MILRSARLVCHPLASSTAIEGVEVRWDTGPDRTLSVVFSVIGAVAQLRVPAAAAPRRVDGLWRHTCFEVFVGRRDSEAYYEFNFAPSGEWAAYAFRKYRECDSIGLPVEPRATATMTDRRFELAALLPLDWVRFDRGEALPLGLSAVVEDQSGTLTYWALEHRPGAPDFHHPDTRTAQLPWDEERVSSG